MRKIALLAAALLFLPGTASAATYVLTPGFGGAPAGRTFTVQVSVSATDQAINAISGVLSFPTEKLQVVSLATAGSVVDSWVREPSYSNAAGTVSFEGAIFNPGYQGPSGRVLAVTFRALAPGDALVAFRQAAILANDGLGTSVLTGMTGARYVLTEAVVAPTKPVTPSATPTAAPPPGLVITSDTHPSPDAWSNTGEARFRWNLPDGASGVQYGLDRAATGTPAAVTGSATGEAAISLGDRPEDGSYYFHLRVFAPGRPDAVYTRRILVDRTPPESLEISQVEPADRTDPRRELQVSASDALAGLDRVEASWDGGSVRLDAADSRRFMLPALPPGTTEVLVRAVDKAGNGREARAYVHVEAIAAPSLEASREPAAVFGQGTPGDDVVVTLRDEDGVIDRKIGRVGENGRWRVPYPDLARGRWEIRAFARDERGAQSEAVGPLAIGTSRLASRTLAAVPWALAAVLGGTLLVVLWRRRKQDEEVEVPIRFDAGRPDGV